MEVFACAHISVFFMVCDNDVAFMDCIHIFYTIITKWSIYKCTISVSGICSAMYSAARRRWHRSADFSVHNKQMRIIGAGGLGQEFRAFIFFAGQDQGVFTPRKDSESIAITIG